MCHGCPLPADGTTRLIPVARWARRPATRRAAAAVVGLAVLATGCTTSKPAPGPDLDAARAAAGALAEGLAKKDLTPLVFTGATGEQVDALFQPLVRGMGPVAPAVAVTGLTASGSSATATLTYTWTFPGVPRPWSYESSAQLTQDAGQWKPTWTPAVVEPRLDGSNRLTQHRRYPERGELLGEDGDPIVTKRPVVRIGIDKSEITTAQVTGSARRLATLLDLDAQAYERRVRTAGSSAFVEAITFRATDPQRPANRTVSAVPGALAIEDEAMLAPTRDFARALIGTVGDATAEAVDASRGAVVAGDKVGLTGLQKRYDELMRGIPGVQVELVPIPPRGGTQAGATPSPTASPTPTEDPTARITVFDVAAVDGRELTTTLNLDLQRLAERTLARTRPAAALVALRPSSGAVLAVANGPGTDGQALATTGQVAPGSTFKVASALALLRAGLTPETLVRCPRTVTVSGRTYENYDDYPSSELGTISLRTALAQSCNTAFVGQRGRLRDGDLAAAAASLGLGTDYDVGFPSYFGAVPPGGSETAKAEAMFGQGTVLASPLAMATVAASVQAGRTVLPTLLQNQRATSTAAPLTAVEATTLQQMMRTVVTSGSGRRLAALDEPAVIAKTGTAEYGTKTPLRTHAWMIAAQGDLAVAVFVADGASGSRTAGPLLESFLRAAG